MEFSKKIEIPLSLAVTVLILAGVQSLLPYQHVTLAPADRSYLTAAVTDTTDANLGVIFGITGDTETAIKNAEVYIKPLDKHVTLTNGYADFPAGTVDKQSFVGSISYGNKSIEFSDYVFGTYDLSFGGSGLFQTIALFKKTQNSITFVDLFPVGDRIRIDSLQPTTADNSPALLVTYFDRNTGETFGDTAIYKKTLTLKYSASGFEPIP